MTDVRVRFAPSPTGFMHMGNARTALFNWLFARKNNGKFILRIEDTDAERSTEESTEMIIRDLTWLNLKWDEGFDKGGEYGPYRQTDRRNVYQDHLDRLEKDGHIYPCYCTPDELEAMRDEQKQRNQMPRYDNRCRHVTDQQKQAFEAEGRTFVWRFKVPDQPIVVHDLIRGEITFDPKTIGDFVLTKSTGGVTFNFAVSVDDGCMKISHVIRGEDHLTNTARHVLLFDALGYPRPQFAHMPMILGADGSKLSKRNGLVSIDDYRKQGFLPEAMVNYMSFLGWSPQKDQGEEIFSLGELAERFELKDITKSPATFNVTKLKWVNAHYLRELDLDRLATMSLPVLRKAGLVEENTSEDEFTFVKDLVGAVKGNLECLDDLPQLCQVYLKEELVWEDVSVRDNLSSRDAKSVLVHFREQLQSLESLSEETIKQALKLVQKETGAKGKGLFLPIRLALSAQSDGVELYKMIELLGQKRCLKRLNDAILI